MDTEIESNPIPTKRPRISVGESAVDQHQEAEMEASLQKRWLCNELVWELCLRIPTTKTADSILLTAHKMYAYLAPGFSKKLVYRDAIAFLKAKSNDIFTLETNQFRVEIWNLNYSPNVMCWLYNLDAQFENVHLLYFLRLIAPLVQPIRLYSHSSIPMLVRFLNTQSDWIDSTELWNNRLNSEPNYGALSKYSKLEINGSLSPVNVPKMVHWLNSNNNNNGHSKKCVSLRQDRLSDGLTLLIEELKKEFVRATSPSRFVVRLKVFEPLDEFTLCNESTGEKLKMRRIGVEDGRTIYALIRFHGLDDNENDCTNLGGTGVNTTVYLIYANYFDLLAIHICHSIRVLIIIFSDIYARNWALSLLIFVCADYSRSFSN